MAEDSEKPKRSWGIKQSIAAGTVMTVGQMYALYEVVLPRKEAEIEFKRVSRLEKRDQINEERYAKAMLEINSRLVSIESSLKYLERETKKSAEAEEYRLQEEEKEIALQNKETSDYYR